MTPPLGPLYQRRILDHARRAMGAGRLTAPDTRATVLNPLCGDRVTIDLAVAEDRIASLGHDVRGCLLCRAAASVLGARAPGTAIPTFRALAAQFEDAVRETGRLSGDAWNDLTVFLPVHGYRSRHECVLLPFQAVIRALDALDGPRT